MSIRATQLVWRESKAESGARLVMLAIADYARDELIAWPSVGTIAEMTRMTDRAVQKCLRAQEKAGELAVVELGGGKFRPTKYRITLPQTVNPSSPFPSSNGELSDTQTVNSETPNGELSCIKRCPGVHPSRKTRKDPVVSQPEAAATDAEWREEMRQKYPGKDIAAIERKCRNYFDKHNLEAPDRIKIEEWIQNERQSRGKARRVERERIHPSSPRKGKLHEQFFPWLSQKHGASEGDYKKASPATQESFRDEFRKAFERWSNRPKSRNTGTANDSFLMHASFDE